MDETLNGVGDPLRPERADWQPPTLSRLNAGETTLPMKGGDGMDGSDMVTSP
jgi:hypothetical protein